MLGLPVWVELELGRQVYKTKVMGSKKATFDEVIRIYLTDDNMNDEIMVRAYTSKVFGKRLLGTARIPMNSLTPNVVSPMTLRPDDNPSGVIAVQLRYMMKKFVMPLDELKRLKALPEPLEVALASKTLRQRHTTEDPVLAKRIHDLKEVCRWEECVYVRVCVWIVYL